jgi:hypothetical protein
MFTLKLYRRVSPDAVITKVLSVHHIQTMSFEHIDPDDIDAVKHKALELWAYDGPEPGPYLSFLIGEREKHGLSSEARDAGIVLRPEHDWWGWGLLENESGRTTEHFRPAGYG